MYKIRQCYYLYSNNKIIANRIFSSDGNLFMGDCLYAVHFKCKIVNKFKSDGWNNVPEAEIVSYGNSYPKRVYTFTLNQPFVRIDDLMSDWFDLEDHPYFNLINIPPDFNIYECNSIKLRCKICHEEFRDYNCGFVCYDSF